MKHEKCLPMIEGYVEGDLDGQTAERVAAHINICATCVDLYEQLLEERECYAHYRREVQVTPELLAAILAATIEKEKVAARLRQNPHGGASAWWAGVLKGPYYSVPAITYLFVVILLGAGGLLALNWRGSRPAQQFAGKADNAGTVQPSTSLNSATHPTNDASRLGRQVMSETIEGRRAALNDGVHKANSGINDLTKSSTAFVRRATRRPESGARTNILMVDDVTREAELRYLKAIKIVSRDVLREQVRVDPGVRAHYDQALRIVDLTIAETRQAVREQAGDPVAVHYLLTAYAKKVELLREMGSN